MVWIEVGKMTVFQIDTGAEVQAFDPVNLLPDWFRDQNDENAPFDKLAYTYGQWMLEEVQRPAKAATARKHLLFSWRFLSHLAEVHPEIFDDIFAAYAARVEGVE